MTVLDAGARERLVDRFGPGVKPWCDALPGLVAELADRWDLEDVEALPGGNTGRAFTCRAAGRYAVLKLTPETGIAATEAAALHTWRHCSRVVDLLDSDRDAGAVLLSGIRPGTRLAGRHIPLAAVGDLLTQLRELPPPSGRFPTLAERVEFMFDLAARRAGILLPQGILERSRAAALAVAEDGPVTLLHGDLHPGNVLDGGHDNPAVAIDPRPCLGDPTFDAIDWAVLPLAHGGTLDDGIAALQENLPGLDPDRLRHWCSATAVLLALSPLRRDGPNAYTDALLALAP